MHRYRSWVIYDPKVDMAYVKVVEPEVRSSVKQVVVDDVDLPGQVVIDIDRDGRIRGFELFDGSRSLPVKLLDAFREVQS
jgi:uncharacterized protein YuzE